MSKEEIKKIVTNKLKKIAPEADFDSLDKTENIREELDIDSIDWLNFLVDIDKELGISIPEADYDQLDTLERILDYLSSKKMKV